MFGIRAPLLRVLAKKMFVAVIQQYWLTEELGAGFHRVKGSHKAGLPWQHA
jgi:hypothetical protein